MSRPQGTVVAQGPVAVFAFPLPTGEVVVLAPTVSATFQIIAPEADAAIFLPISAEFQVQL